MRPAMHMTYDTLSCVDTLKHTQGGDYAWYAVMMMKLRSTPRPIHANAGQPLGP